MTTQSLTTRKKTAKKNSSSGQTIIEVLVATTVVGIVLTGLVIGMTFSLRNAAAAKARSLATRYAQEANEVFRRERDLQGWEPFSSTFQGGATRTYCLPALPETTTEFRSLTPADCSAGTYIQGTDFTREVEVRRVSPSEVEVSTTVSWPDGSRTPEVVLTQTLKDF